ncbi:hypothetical protein [Haladaptatus halobius]|nr:hypothetical protein [Haladaptatus halobius]
MRVYIAGTNVVTALDATIDIHRWKINFENVLGTPLLTLYDDILLVTA